MLNYKRSNVSATKHVCKRRVLSKGRGLLNSLIDKLPFELHIPTYNYCGAGTKLTQRLARGDKGINLLDEHCKEHDIAYSQFKDTKNRNQADKILAQKAFERVKDSDSSIAEKIAALAVAGVMKAKSKMGMGLRKMSVRKMGMGLRKMGIGLRKKRGRSIGKGFNKLKPIKSLRTKSKRKHRLIATPKTGGFLPFLLPIIGALGALASGASTITSSVLAQKSRNKQQAELERHNKELEAIAKQHKGSGLFLKPFSKGFGIQLLKKKSPTEITKTCSH